MALEKQARQTNKSQLAKLLSHTLTPLITSHSIVHNHKYVLWKALHQRGRPYPLRELSLEHISLTLFLQRNPRSTAIQAVAKANKLDLEIVDTDVTKGPVLSTEYLKLNKLGKIPSFVGADGYELTECIAIAIYSTLLSSWPQPYPHIHDEKSFQIQLSLSEDYC